MGSVLRHRMKFIFCVWAALMSTTLYAQPSGLGHAPIPSKSIEFRAGYIQLKEQNIHSRVFHGLEYGFAFKSFWQKNGISVLNLELHNALHKTTNEDEISSATAGLILDLNHLFDVYRSENWQFHSGTGAILHYHLGYYWMWDESRMYWANFLGLNFTQMVTYESSNNKRFVGALTIPVVMLLSRPNRERDYKIDDFSFQGIIKNMHSSPELLVLQNALSVNASLTYVHNRTNKMHPHLIYSVRYRNLSTQHSDSFKSIHHTIGFLWDI